MIAASCERSAATGAGGSTAGRRNRAIERRQRVVVDPVGRQPFALQAGDEIVERLEGHASAVPASVQQLLHFLGRRQAASRAKAPAVQRRDRVGERQRVLHLARPEPEGIRRRSRHETRRPRRCCRRTGPETPACGSRGRRTGRGFLPCRASRTRAARANSSASASSARPGDGYPVYSLGNCSAAIMASMCASSSPICGRTFSTSTIVSIPASRAKRAACAAARVSWQSTMSTRPAVTASRSTASGSIVRPRCRCHKTVRSPVRLSTSTTANWFVAPSTVVDLEMSTPRSGQARSRQLAEVVVAEPADVAGRPAEPRADAESGRNLAARHAVRTGRDAAWSLAAGARKRPRRGRCCSSRGRRRRTRCMPDGFSRNGRRTRGCMPERIQVQRC